MEVGSVANYALYRIPHAVVGAFVPQVHAKSTK